MRRSSVSLQADGQRYIASGTDAGMRAVARDLAHVFNVPKYGYKVPTKGLPYAMMWLASWFDKAAASAIGRVGKSEKFDSSKVRVNVGGGMRRGHSALTGCGHLVAVSPACSCCRRRQSSGSSSSHFRRQWWTWASR